MSGSALSSARYRPRNGYLACRCLFGATPCVSQEVARVTAGRRVSSIDKTDTSCRIDMSLRVQLHAPRGNVCWSTRGDGRYKAGEEYEE